MSEGSSLVQPAFALNFSSTCCLVLILCRLIWIFSLLSYLLKTPPLLCLSLSPFFSPLHQEHISEEEMFVCLNSSKRIMWLILGILFLELGSRVSTAGWGTQTSDMFTDWERFPPLSQGIQVIGWVAQTSRLQDLPWLGQPPYSNCLLLSFQKVSYLLMVPTRMTAASSVPDLGRWLPFFKLQFFPSADLSVTWDDACKRLRVHRKHSVNVNWDYY